MKLRRLVSVVLLPMTVAIAAQNTAPVLALRVNGRGGSEQPLPLWRGEPVLAEVWLRHADANASEPISLDPAGGAWATRVKISVTDERGAAVPLPFVLTGKNSEGAFALQPRAITTLVFRLAGETTAAPKPGRYQMVARLELPDGRAWRGSVACQPLMIEVVAPPAQLTSEQLGRRQLLRLRDALLAADLQRAESIALELWNADRKRPEGWVARALVSEAKGDPMVALVQIDKAIALAIGVTEDQAESEKSKPSAKTVPLEYVSLRQRIERNKPAEP